MRITSAFILVMVFILSACQGKKDQVPASVVNIPNTASGEADLDALPKFEFMETIHDFGKVIQGEVVTFSFRFKNTGGSDLLISGVSASCGCTATKYPKDPVKPGQQEVIEVSFNSGGKQGFQNKTLTVAANTQPSTTVLSIKAEVVLPEKE